MTGSNPTTADFLRFLRTSEPPELDAGPRAGVLSARGLNSDLDAWFAAHAVSPEAALRLRALTLLYHDEHDAAHDLVQDLTDRDGALIHALLHRREPDYWNAKYWFRRTDEHPVYLALATRVKALCGSPDEVQLARQLTLPGAFDPHAFVDLCEQVARRPLPDPQVDWLQRVQQAEFEAVAEHLLSA